MSAQPSLLGWAPPKRLSFDGPAYEPKHDRVRLSEQHVRIRELMLDGQWRTVAEIGARTGDPEPSVSAQLRHLRKERFGAFTVDRRKRGDRKRGLYEYRVAAPDPNRVKDYGNDSKQLAQRLRDELRMLRSVALEAAEILESVEIGGSEGERWELVARMLRERSAGLVAP